MIVKKVELNNFRNYKSLSLDLDEKTNILYGNNAQGKTNVLESIYVCSTTKSHRTNKDSELINLDSSEAHIKIYIEKKSREHRIDILKVLDQEEVSMYFTNPKAPCFIKDEEGSYVYIVLPVVQ